MHPGGGCEVQRPAERPQPSRITTRSNRLHVHPYSRFLSTRDVRRCANASQMRPVPESNPLTAEFLLPHPSPAAIFKELDEGGVLLSTADEVYFGVNPVGARIWSLLPPNSTTFGELCASLQRQYPDAGAEQIKADVQAFLEALIESGLVVSSKS